MSNRIFILVLLGLFMFATGCITTNWTHNRRHFKQVREEVRQLHQDFDRIFLDLEPHPTEQQLSVLNQDYRESASTGALSFCVSFPLH